MIKTLHLPKGSTRDDVRRLTLEHVDRIVGEQLAKYEQSLLAGAEEHGSSLEDIASD